MTVKMAAVMTSALNVLCICMKIYFLSNMQIECRRSTLKSSQNLLKSKKLEGLLELLP